MNPYECPDELKDEFYKLVFEPLHNYMSSGKNIQICKTNHKDVDIYIRSVFPYNVFKEPYDVFTVDLVLPIQTEVENGCMEVYYHDEGYASPEFKTLVDSIRFINNYKKENI